MSTRCRCATRVFGILSVLQTYTKSDEWIEKNEGLTFWRIDQHRHFYTTIMNRLSFLFKNDPKKYLGRWSVETCQLTLHAKILMANEDHCGTCGSSAISSRIMEHAKLHKSNKIRESKTKTDAARRYNEYLNAAVRGRKVLVTDPDLERQIEYYICMH